MIIMASSGGDISRENLERHRIIYDEEAYTCDCAGDNASSNVRSSLPDHVNALREALLAFSDIIPDDWKETFDAEFLKYRGDISEQECLQPSAAAYFTPPRYKLRNPTPQATAADRNIETCQDIAAAARKRAKEVESGWTHFLRRYIFGDFDEENNSRTEIE